MLVSLTILAIMIFIIISPYLVKKYLNLDDFTGLGLGILSSLAQIILYGIMEYILLVVIYGSKIIYYYNYYNIYYFLTKYFESFLLLLTIFGLCHYYFLKLLYKPQQKKGVIFMYISGNIFLFTIISIGNISGRTIESLDISLKHSFYLIITFIIFLIYYIGLPVCIYYYHKTNDKILFYVCIFLIMEN